MLDSLRIPSPLEAVPSAYFGDLGIQLYVKRDDLIHPQISGNKWRKLTYNLQAAKQRGHHTILTFGGAHSNHIAATAAACQLAGLKAVGIIRGTDSDQDNATLAKASELGMVLHRITRSAYRAKDQPELRQELKERFGNCFIIPEGGANFYGVQGAQAIAKELPSDIDRIFLACGTGTTAAGMLLALPAAAQLYGVAVLKGAGFLHQNIRHWLRECLGDGPTELDLLSRMNLLLQYHHGGYARISDELLQFIPKWNADTGIPIEPVYTAKAAYAMYREAGKLTGGKKEKWVLVHTGGLQGLSGMQARYGKSFE